VFVTIADNPFGVNDNLMLNEVSIAATRELLKQVY